MGQNRKLKKRAKTDVGGKGKPVVDFEVPSELRLFSDVELQQMGLGNARTRRNLRCLGKDPIPFVRVGKLIRYKLEDVLEYIEKNRVISR